MNLSNLWGPYEYKGIQRTLPWTKNIKICRSTEGGSGFDDHNEFESDSNSVNREPGFGNTRTISNPLLARLLI